MLFDYDPSSCSFVVVVTVMSRDSNALSLSKEWGTNPALVVDMM